MNNNKIVKAIYEAAEYSGFDKFDVNRNGVLLESIDGKLNIVATDGHRMYHNVINIDIKDFSFLIPIDQLKTLKKQFNNNKTILNINLDRKSIKFTNVNAEFHVDLIETNFPNYNYILKLAQDYSRLYYIDFKDIDIKELIKNSKNHESKYGVVFDFKEKIVKTTDYKKTIKFYGNYEGKLLVNTKFLDKMLKNSTKVFIVNKHSMIHCVNENKTIVVMPLYMSDDF